MKQDISPAEKILCRFWHFWYVLLFPHLLLPLPGASAPSSVLPGSSDHYLEGFAWCLSTLSLWLWWPSRMSLFFHLQGNKRSQAAAVHSLTKLLWGFYECVCRSMVSVPCAGFRSLSVLCFWALLLHQSASLRNLIQYHMLVKWQAIAKLAGISQNCKNYANWFIKMQVSMIYQLPTYLPTDFYDLFDLQDAHIFIYFSKCTPNIKKSNSSLGQSQIFLIIKSIWKYVWLCMYRYSEK